MAERKREIQVKFWVTPEEKKMIRKKMILSRTANMGAYLRKMAIDGIIVNTDTTYLEKHFFEMQKCHADKIHKRPQTFKSKRAYHIGLLFNSKNFRAFGIR